MAIELKQSLKLSQQLVITPQLQQAIKLLQLSRMELSELVQGELLENPVLEEAVPEEEEEVPPEVAKEIETEEVQDKSHEASPEVTAKEGEFKEKEFDWDNYISTYNAPGEEMKSFSRGEELPPFENIVTKTTTLSDHLEWQLHMASVSEHEEEIAVAIIGALDDNGYLTSSLEEIAEKNGFGLEEAEDALSLIQDFDPSGVGARNLKECLLLQTRFFGEDKVYLNVLINDHLHFLERKDYYAIAKKMKISLERVVSLAHVIANMEPKPGRPFGGSAPQFITPDVYVQKVASEYVVVLNDEGLPRLHVSSFYQNLLSQSKKGLGDNLAKGYIEEKLKKAVWLIKSIHQRQRTLYRVAKSIVEAQRDFLEKGAGNLKPMILKDVADKIGVHESTVSRATSNKYMHTPQGLYELKFFFNGRVSQMDGVDIASETVKEKIKRLVQNENARKPLSDKNIADLLKSANINVARRTVAKYREMLGILPSSRRRQLY